MKRIINSEFLLPKWTSVQYFRRRFNWFSSSNGYFSFVHFKFWTQSHCVNVWLPPLLRIKVSHLKVSLTVSLTTIRYDQHSRIHWLRAERRNASTPTHNEMSHCHLLILLSELKSLRRIFSVCCEIHLSLFCVVIRLI